MCGPAEANRSCKPASERGCSSDTSSGEGGASAGESRDSADQESKQPPAPPAIAAARELEAPGSPLMVLPGERKRDPDASPPLLSGPDEAGAHMEDISLPEPDKQKHVDAPPQGETVLVQLERERQERKARKRALANAPLNDGPQWKYYLFFNIKALVLAGTIAMVLVNCNEGPPPEQRLAQDSQALSVAGQTCQINPTLDSWWPALVTLAAAQLLWTLGAAVYYAVTGWYPRNAGQVYLLQLPVSTTSVVAAGVGLAGGGWLVLALSWVVVSLLSGFAVVLGLLAGVPGLFGGGGEAAEDAGVAGAEGGAVVGATAAKLESPDSAAQPGKKPEVLNPYEVTVQQYGRWYTMLLLVYEFNAIGCVGPHADQCTQTA